MSDEDIIKYFIKDGHLIANKMHKENLEKVPEMIDYLNHRFSEEFDSYNEVIARIYHKIEEKPKCKICGKYKKFSKFKIPYTNNPWCSQGCQLRDKDFKDYVNSNTDKDKKRKRYEDTMMKRYGDINYRNVEKSKQTCLEKYGCEYFLSKDSPKRKEMEEKMMLLHGRRTNTNVEKIKETKLQRYGDSSYSNDEKRKNTMKERYGAETTLQSEELRAKVKKTMELRYGNKDYVNYKKISETTKKRYGVDNVFQLESVRSKIDYDKINQTKRINHSFNSSNAEDRLESILVNIFGRENVERNYKDKRYINEDTNIEYVCDFYIREYDIFIELQGHYTHGEHPFDENNIDDIKKREELTNKPIDKPSYKKIIEVWCDADVRKRNVALKNKLRYIEIFGVNFSQEDVIKKVNEICGNIL